MHKWAAVSAYCSLGGEQKDRFSLASQLCKVPCIYLGETQWIQCVDLSLEETQSEKVD